MLDKLFILIKKNNLKLEIKLKFHNYFNFIIALVYFSYKKKDANFIYGQFKLIRKMFEINLFLI